MVLAAAVTFLGSQRAHAPFCVQWQLLGNPPSAVDSSLSIFEADGGGCLWTRKDLDEDPIPLFRAPVPCKLVTIPKFTRNRRRALIGYYDLGAAPAFHAFEADFSNGWLRAFPPYPLRGLTPDSYLPSVGYAADDQVLLQRMHQGICLPYRFRPQLFGLGCSSSIVELRSPSIDGWRLQSWLRNPGGFQVFFDWREVGGTWRSASKGDGFAAFAQSPSDATEKALRSKVATLCPRGWPDWNIRRAGSVNFAETEIQGGGRCLVFAEDSSIILLRRLQTVWRLETQGEVLLTRASQDPSGASRLYDVRSGRELFASRNPRVYFWPARDFK